MHWKEKKMNNKNKKNELKDMSKYAPRCEINILNKKKEVYEMTQKSP